jgi:HlyD family secretion protein
MSPTAPAQSAPAKPRKSSKMKWVLIGGTALFVVLGVAIAVKNKGAGAGLPVTTDKAIVKTITQLVTATGKVQPEIEVKIAPEVSGEITALPFKEGAVVKKGDMVVSIKPDQYQAAVDQQEASLVAARASAVLSKAQLLQAQSDFKRSDDLFAKQLISDSDYTTAKTNVDVAQANVDNALAQIRRNEGSLNQAQDFLNKTTIYAPMDGAISALESEVGERVVGTGTMAGTEIMRVADLSHMELRVQVNENDIVNVKLGDHAVISIDAYPNRKFTGSVSEIGSSAQGTSATSAVTADVTNFLVKIRIEDKDAQLRPGMSATCDIETQTVENVIAIPIQSVTVRAEGGLTSEEYQKKKATDSQNKSGNTLDPAAEKDAARRDREKLSHVVFVKIGDKVKMEKVETGIADNTYIEVKSGIKAGDEVVSGSYAAISRKLKDDMVVQIEKPKKEDEKK